MAKALYQFELEHRFGEFAAPGTICRKKISARHLHGDGAGALHEIMGMPDVGPCSTDDPDEVEAGVLKEALVFRGKNGLYQLGRQIVVTHRALFFAEAVEEVGDEFRLNLRRAHIGAATERADGANDPAAELYGQSVATREEGEFRRPDIECVALNSVCAERILIGIGTIAGALEVGHQIVRAPCLTVGNVFGSGENLGSVLQDVAGEPKIDHLRILDVVEGEDGRGKNEACSHGSEQAQPERRSPETFLNTQSQRKLPEGGLRSIVS